MPSTMSKNTRITVFVALAAVLLIAIAWLGQDLFLNRGETIDCGKGDIRRSIDLRDFTTRYWGYSVELEARVAERGKLVAKLEPRQFLQLSEAMQQGRDFRQFLVAGYNACAIGKAQYTDYGAKFQALDGLAQQIDKIAGQEPPDKARLEELVRQYIALTQALASATP